MPKAKHAYMAIAYTYITFFVPFLTASVESQSRIGTKEQGADDETRKSKERIFGHF